MWGSIPSESKREREREREREGQTEIEGQRERRCFPSARLGWLGVKRECVSIWALRAPKGARV